MAVEIITREDLALFKRELIQELHELFTSTKAPTAKKWVKSYEVREMLNISPGTLQNMRINGTIAYSKIGGLIFYDYDDIIKLMEKDKKSAGKPQRGH
ncbi:helix-turn-helix domain-containing protein [Chitinophaga agrisoli]|uniref:Helix-turn-helix domain-containing protein n=1 Tax=Chitinophaga agrisoli TaxID=2607653 RepID=A0A5B2VMS7_9BACT|nr:helix-turn-helix domain-containing protein [Chitinophaga agrisoli]KAA2240305.1 helix-turn-helix domain-containing protein [Chitinophaga agrisoli]